MSACLIDDYSIWSLVAHFKVVHTYLPKEITTQKLEKIWYPLKNLLSQKFEKGDGWNWKTLIVPLSTKWISELGWVWTLNVVGQVYVTNSHLDFAAATDQWVLLIILLLEGHGTAESDCQSCCKIWEIWTWILLKKNSIIHIGSVGWALSDNRWETTCSSAQQRLGGSSYLLKEKPPSPYKVELIVRIWQSLLGDLTAAVHALKAGCSSYLSVSILGYSHLLEHSSLLSGSRYFVHFFCTYSFYFANRMNCFTKSSSFLPFSPSPSPHFFSSPSFVLIIISIGPRDLLALVNNLCCCCCLL